LKILEESGLVAGQLDIVPEQAELGVGEMNESGHLDIEHGTAGPVHGGGSRNIRLGVNQAEVPPYQGVIAKIPDLYGIIILYQIAEDPGGIAFQLVIGRVV
jgi:hypothetical protein